MAGVFLSDSPAAQASAKDQNEQEPSTKEIPGKGMPPRAAASEYQAQGKAGAVTIGAEFDGPLRPHARAYLFVGRLHCGGGRALWRRRARTSRSRATIFRCAINGKKTLLCPASLTSWFSIRSKIPSGSRPKRGGSKASKSSLTTGGGGDGGGDKLPPIPPKMPFPLRRAMEQHVQKSAMQEGDRPLPQAGLLFFRYSGKAEGIKSLELVYSGAAGRRR